MDLKEGLLRDKNGLEVPLRSQTVEVLLVLCRQAGHVVSKAKLMEAVWGDTAVTDDSLVQCITEIRRALCDHDHVIVQTLVKRGYRLVPSRVRGAARSPVSDAAALRFGLAEVRPSDGQLLQPTAAPSTTGSWRNRADSFVPKVLSPLIGRDDDLDALGRLVAQHPLVTITGAGGIGKTRLAEQLLRRQQDAIDVAACWVELAAQFDPALVVSEIVGALGLQTGRGHPLEALVAALQATQLFLVLDNAEYCVGEVGRVAVALLAGAPRVRILVTSQVPLRCAGEYDFRLSGLAVPELDGVDQIAVDEALAYSAIALFAERAQAADRHFKLTSRNVQSVIDVCRRLDGNALTIELAAARVAHLGLPGLLGSLNDRFRILTTGHHDAPARQRTLRAALDWSHGLLDPGERALLRRIGVFVGGWGLELMQELLIDGGTDPPICEGTVLDLLGSLIDRSLVVVQISDQARFRLLESTRIFALERLEEAGELVAYRRRHAIGVLGHFTAIRAEYWTGRLGKDSARMRLVPDLDNARQALSWAIENDPMLAVSLAPVVEFSMMRYQHQEIRALWEATAGCMTDDLPAMLRANWAKGYAFFMASIEPAKCRSWAELAVDLFRRMDDRVNLYLAFGAMYMTVQHANCDEGLVVLDRMREVESPDWPDRVKSVGAWSELQCACGNGDIEMGLSAARRLLEHSEKMGSSEGAGIALHFQVLFTLGSGDALGALRLAEQLEKSLQDAHDTYSVCGVRALRTTGLLARGEMVRARSAAQQGWPPAVQFDLKDSWADNLALLAALEGRAQSAARLCGYADAVYARYGTRRHFVDRQVAARTDRLARRRLGDEDFERYKREGAELLDMDVGVLAFGTTDR